MNSLPSFDSSALSLGPVTKLVVVQIAAGFLLALATAAMPESGGVSAVGGLLGAIAYAAWAEIKVPGCLPPRIARKLALRVSIVQFVVASPFLVFLAMSTPPTSRETLPLGGWLAIAVFIWIFVFLTTWLGLALGRRIGGTARRRGQGKFVDC